MSKRWTLPFLIFGLFLFLLTGCHQNADKTGASISDSQLYATAYGTFLQTQRWQLKEMDGLLQEIEALTPDDAYALGHVVGRAAAIQNAGDAYHALLQTDGLIVTGPTGTNVNDLSVLLLRR